MAKKSNLDYTTSLTCQTEELKKFFKTEIDSLRQELEARTRLYEANLKSLTATVVRLEDQMRSKNLLIMGMPEESDEDPLAKVKDIIHTKLRLDPELKIKLARQAKLHVRWFGLNLSVDDEIIDTISPLDMSELPDENSSRQSDIIITRSKTNNNKSN